MFCCYALAQNFRAELYCRQSWRNSGATITRSCHNHVALCKLNLYLTPLSVYNSNPLCPVQCVFGAKETAQITLRGAENIADQESTVDVKCQIHPGVCGVVNQHYLAVIGESVGL